MNKSIDFSEDRVDFIAEAESIVDDLIAYRRRIHEFPEVGLDLPRTQEAVLEGIKDLDLEIRLGESLSSVTGVLRGSQPGPTVLLRGDMDALPIREANDLPYRSKNENMHACGHDMHTAGLIGAARLLSAHREDIKGNVVFMFQPGEEGYNGASHMIREGVLEASGERPVAAYAIHVGTGNLGVFRTRPGPIMASSNRVRGSIVGTGGHGSNPAGANDPVPALAEIVLGVQSLVTRTVPVHDPAVLTISRLTAGTADNVIPEKVSFSGTLRMFSTDLLDVFEGNLQRFAQGIAAAHGLSGEISITRDYPVTLNDVELTKRARGVIEELFGPSRFEELANPFMGSEDFSFVLDEIPGTYIVLGARPEEFSEGAFYPHSPDVQFDDSVLGDQSALLAALAWQHVGSVGVA